MVPPGAAPVTNRKRLRARRGEAPYIPLDLTGGPQQSGPRRQHDCLSCREGGPPCLRTSPPLGRTLEVHRTSWRIPFPRHACIEAVAAGSPYRYPLWLARALNSAIYDVKWDYESYRAIARIAVFYVKIAVFYNKFMLLCPIL